MTQTTTISSAGTYSVTVTDINGCSNSDSVTATVNTLPVIDLGADQTVCDNASLTIDAGTGFSGYIWNTNETTQSIIVNGSLFAAGTYTYWVNVTGSNGCDAADTMMVTVDLCTGIANNSDIAVFNVYPNPSQGQFVVSTSSALEDVILEITDIEGRIIYKEKINEFTSKTIQLDNPSTGIYFLKIGVGGNMTIQKININ
jgi:hypothetical protein